MVYKKLIRPLLFSVDPEVIHETALAGLNNFLFQTLFKIVCQQKTTIKKTVFGIDFPNPVGLAAGFDKDAAAIDGFASMGFGFIEIGTVTPNGQPGNPKHRLFRLPQDQALINRMGFNNRGVEQVVENIKKRRSEVIIGGNIGKNKITSNEKAVDDYLKCFNALYNHVDYFVVNVSSPNTPGLRELQEKKPLMEILNRLQEQNHKKQRTKPILLKIAPDITDSQLDDIVAIIEETKSDGIVATNTTISRSNLSTSTEKVETMGAGGLSGAPLKKRSTEIIQKIKSRSKMPVIGVGGIMSPEDALEKIKAGADLIQIYTGFIYEGPLLVKRINRYLCDN
ncbi:MAG: quinone-dependent dihydroorotate dehydrogenase [Calditrichaeota bacterium]|nr:quinone-dependent dihydroorotate dehydrogenase [Calditrichota bacterium]